MNNPKETSLAIIAWALACKTDESELKAFARRHLCAVSDFDQFEKESKAQHMQAFSAAFGPANR